MPLTFELNYDNDGLVVTGGEGLEGDVIIPSETQFEGKTHPVSEIKQLALQGNSAITTITIPETVKKIGEGAFSCLNLKEFRLHPMALFYTNDAKNILFQKVVVGHDFNTGIYKFQWSIKAVANAGLEGVVTIPEFVTKIEAGAFLGCQNLTDVVFHDKVIEIGKGAFGFCSGLTHVTLPPSITIIEPETFMYCEQLESIVMTNVKEIGDYAFSCCTSLKEIRFPVSLVHVGNSAFENCTHLSQIVINDDSLLEEAGVPENVEIIKP